MSEVSGGHRHRRPSRGRTLWPAGLVLLLLLATVVALRYQSLVRPTPAQLLARAHAARSDLQELSFVLSTPWPQAYPAVSTLPGARALLGPVEGQRIWRILWHQSLGSRAEVLEPQELAGTLTVVSPESFWVYSPLLELALTGPATELPALYIDQLLDMAAAAGSYRLLPRSQVDGRDTLEIACTISGPPAVELRLGLDSHTYLPVRASVLDENGRIAGSLQASGLNTSPASGVDDFAFSAPAGTRTLGTGLVRSYPNLAAAAADLPFSPLEPEYLPAGFVLQAVNILGQPDQLAVVLSYLPAGDDAGGGLLSLTQSLAGPDYQPLPYGLPQHQNGWSGRQFDLGELRGVDWRSGALSLTLFGTVSFPELRRVAASVGR